MQAPQRVAMELHELSIDQLFDNEYHVDSLDIHVQHVRSPELQNTNRGIRLEAEMYKKQVKGSFYQRAETSTQSTLTLGSMMSMSVSALSEFENHMPSYPASAVSSIGSLDVLVSDLEEGRSSFPQGTFFSEPYGPVPCAAVDRQVDLEVDSDFSGDGEQVDAVDLIVGPTMAAFRSSVKQDAALVVHKPGHVSSTVSVLALSDIFKLQAARPGQAPASFGSVNHMYGCTRDLCRPCRDERTAGRCKHGMACEFCHLHEGRRRDKRPSKMEKTLPWYSLPVGR